MDDQSHYELRSDYTLDLTNSDQIVSTHVYRAHVIYNKIDKVYEPAVSRFQRVPLFQNTISWGTNIFPDFGFEKATLAYAFARWFAEEMVEQHRYGVEEWLRRKGPLEDYIE